MCNTPLNLKTMTMLKEHELRLFELLEQSKSEDEQTAKQSKDLLWHETQCRPKDGASFGEWFDFFGNDGTPSDETELCIEALVKSSRNDTDVLEGCLWGLKIYKEMPFHNGKAFIRIGYFRLVFVFRDGKPNHCELSVSVARFWASMDRIKLILSAMEMNVVAGSHREPIEFDANAYVAQLSKEGRKQLRLQSGWAANYLSRIATGALRVEPGKNYTQIKRFAEKWIK